MQTSSEVGPSRKRSYLESQRAHTRRYVRLPYLAVSFHATCFTVDIVR